MTATKMSKTKAMKIAKDPGAASVNDMLEATSALRDELRSADRQVGALTTRETALETQVEQLGETTLAQERDALKIQVRKLEAEVGPLKDAVAKDDLQVIKYLGDLPQHVQNVINQLLDNLGETHYCKACGLVYQEGYRCGCGHDNGTKIPTSQWAEPQLAVDNTEYEEDI